MSSCGEYSSSDDKIGGDNKVDGNIGEDTSGVAEGKPDTRNIDLTSPKSASNTYQGKPSLIDSYADPNTYYFYTIDPDT